MSTTLPITVEPATLSLKAGEAGRVQLTVRNTSGASGQFQARVEGGEIGWVSIEPTDFFLSPNEEGQLWVRLMPPVTTERGSYAVVLGIVGRGAGAAEGWVFLDLNIQNATHPLSAVHSPLSEAVQARSAGTGDLILSTARNLLPVQPGRRREVTVQLSNRSGTSHELMVTTEGLPLAWISIEPLTVTLAAGAQLPLTLDLMPTAEAPLGSYPFQLQVSTGGEEPRIVQLALTLELRRHDTLEVRLAPSELRGAGAATASVEVSQRGPLPLRVQLFADGDQRHTFDFAPALISLPPQGRSTSQLTVRSTQPLSEGERTSRFTVRAETSGGEARGEAAGRFVEQTLPAPPLRLTPPRVSSGGPAIFLLQVENPSPMAHSLQLSASDERDSCDYHFASPLLRLPPFGSGESQLTVVPRRAHEDPTPLVHRIRVVAQAQEGGPVGEIRGEYEQEPSAPLQLLISPTQQAASERAQFRLTARNPRSLVAEIDLAVEDPEGIDSILSPARLLLPAGGQAEAVLDVEIVAPLLPGEPRRAHRLSVLGREAGQSEPLVVESQLMQVKARRPWLLWLLPVVGLIAAFLLIEVAADWLRDRDDGPAPTQVAALSIATISPPPITAPTVDSFYTCPTPCAADGSNSQRQFPEGTTEIFVRWSYNEIAPGVAFDRSWTNNNVLYVQYLCRWDQASNGVAEIRLWAPNNDPLPSGQWTMKIAVDQTQLLEESIEIAGNVGPIRLSDPNRSACFD